MTIQRRYRDVSVQATDSHIIITQQGLPRLRIPLEDCDAILHRLQTVSGIANRKSDMSE